MLGRAEFAGTDRFEIKRRLGAGGMGVVYEAFDRERNQTVALKTLKRFDAQALFRFKNEFRALHDIDHPNLISLYELAEQDGDCFFTMELVRGVDFLFYVRTASTSARSDVSAPGPRAYDEPRLRAALAQLAQGVAALHAAGKVHRDIKPSNILVTEEGRVVLVDFGLVTDGQSTQTSGVGTAEYMAPEQALSGDVGPAADWYSVGVVLYEALTTRLPHRGRTAIEILMHKQQRPAAPPRQWTADVPEDLDTLCVELLDRTPSRRPLAAIILGQLGIELDDTALAIRASTSRGFTQTTPFVGREDELATLRAAFEDSVNKPVVVIVEGESGLGKSELVRQFSLRLAHDVPAALVLSGRCYERESMAYKAFDGIVDELSRYMTRLPKVDAAILLPMQAGLLPRLFPVLQRVEVIAAAPREAEIPDPQEMRRQMFGALRELLARLAKRTPLVLFIDDLQWTDTDSLTLLQETLGDVSAPNLLLIATLRPMGDTERKGVFASLSTLEQRHIDLAAFSFEHAKELAANLLPSVDDEALSVIAREAAGHPLFVMELARYAQGQGQGQEITLDQTLWQRISQLPADLLGLLKILCVAGTPITQETAANAAEVSQADLSKAASSLRNAYLVRTGGVRKDDLIEPYHDRVREIVTKHLDDATSKHCHHRLALALEQAGASKTAPQALVRHTEAAGDTMRAAEHAKAAAHHAIEATAFDQAAEFFQTALRLGQYDADETRTLRLTLADSLVNAGRGPEAAEVFLLAAKGGDASTQLDCQRQAAEQWLKSGHTTRGLDAMSELLGQIGVPMPATPRRALLSVLWRRARLRVFGLRWTEKPASQITRDELTRIDIYKAVAHGLIVVDTIVAADFQARSLLLALRTGEPLRIARALFYEAGFIASPGGRKNFARARSLAERAARIDDKDPYLRAWKSAAYGMVDYFSGHFRRAAEHCAVADSRFRNLPGASWELSSFRLFRLWSLLRMGAFAEMTHLMDDYLRDATRRGDLYAQTTLIRSCHLLWLRDDDSDAARAVLEQTVWVLPEGRYHLQHWFAFRAQRELDLYDGTASDLWESPQADFVAVRKSLLLRIVSVRNESWWLRGRLALVSAPGSNHSTKLLKEAARMARLLERDNNVYSIASAFLLRAAIAAQQGNSSDAVSLLATAVTAAEKTDQLLHAAAARRRHGELLSGDEGAALIAQADEWMTDQGIKNAARMTEVFAPGFPR